MVVFLAGCASQPPVVNTQLTEPPTTESYDKAAASWVEICLVDPEASARIRRDFEQERPGINYIDRNRGTESITFTFTARDGSHGLLTSWGEDPELVRFTCQVGLDEGTSSGFADAIVRYGAANRPELQISREPVSTTGAPVGIGHDRVVEASAIVLSALTRGQHGALVPIKAVASHHVLGMLAGGYNTATVSASSVNPDPPRAARWRRPASEN
ncbi:MAG: hypothetical protein AAGE18_15415 [Pseudomonadota bacterium]